MLKIFFMDDGDLAKFRHFGKLLAAFGKFWFGIGQTFVLLWQFYAIGQIFNDTKVQR